ncbi:hypothetical protein [Gimesia aquarii]|uniref:Uncharacterized protein n=2 Tax=Gimesia aquarii TaxID=2527964 RepID=A0A517VWR2_9PLAN|nr:hypothetical protein [Gimesia aquarii]QDT97445.1 hypothetical protein V144x_29200 [Gimesia aquarii]QDU11092.1 hypothetical protein V202x_45080 [Gimesia aquarii]
MYVTGQGHRMFRSTFFATGLFVMLTGASFLFVDKLVLSHKVTTQEPQQVREPEFRGFLGMTSLNKDKQEELNPPDWAAFSLMSVGAVTMLYAVALPKRN